MSEIMARILLVDDQRFLQEFLLYELTQMGHEASCVDDVDALFVFQEEHAPDLLLLDPNFNDLQGWDLLREIKRPGRPRMPTILFTSFGATMRDPRAGLADGYVIKSANTQALGQKILEVLSSSKHSVSNQQRWPDFTQQGPSASPGRSLGWFPARPVLVIRSPASNTTDWMEHLRRPRGILR
jgi:DNA-binding response OmpR family regulator